jgi:hypothetical protein
MFQSCISTIAANDKTEEYLGNILAPKAQSLHFLDEGQVWLHLHRYSFGEEDEVVS